MTRLNQREEKLRCVQRASFMVDDLQLFLDTHPDATEALGALQQYIALQNAATREYEQAYGPLTIEGVEFSNQYDWINCPWPWKVEV